MASADTKTKAPRRTRKPPPTAASDGERIATNAAKAQARFASNPEDANYRASSAIQRCGGLTLAQIYENPAALNAPESVAAYLAYLERSTLLAALPKGGKSTLASAVAAGVSAGAMLLGEKCKQGRVLWVCAEEHISDLARRLKALGANPDNILILPPLVDPLNDLDACAKQYEPRLIVTDVLSSFAQKLISDARSSAAWTPVMNALTNMARERHCASLILGHNKKDDSGFRDSGAIAGGVDVVLEMFANKSDPTVRDFPRPMARWPMSPFSVRKVGDLFVLASGDLTMDSQISAAVTAKPGCSKAYVRDNVKARGSDVDAAVDRLIDAGVLMNRGSDTRPALHVAPSGPGRDPGRDAEEARPEVKPSGRRVDALGTRSEDAISEDPSRSRSLGRDDRDELSDAFHSSQRFGEGNNGER